MNLRHHPGYVGVFTRDQAEGAIPNGAPIVKTFSEPGDPHAPGSKGIVLGSIAVPPGVFPGVTHMYFVEWDALPGVAIGIMSRKIRQVRQV